MTSFFFRFEPFEYDKWFFDCYPHTPLPNQILNARTACNARRSTRVLRTPDSSRYDAPFPANAHTSSLSYYYFQVAISDSGDRFQCGPSDRTGTHCVRRTDLTYTFRTLRLENGWGGGLFSKSNLNFTNRIIAVFGKPFFFFFIYIRSNRDCIETQKLIMIYARKTIALRQNRVAFGHRVQPWSCAFFCETSRTCIIMFSPSFRSRLVFFFFF